MRERKSIWKLTLPLFLFVFLLLMGAETAWADTYTSNIQGMCEPYYCYRASMQDVTVTGDTYAGSICFDTYNNIAGEACLDLDGNYMTFSFVAGSINGKSGNDRTLSIEADGTKIYERVVGYNEVPKADSISVQGVKQLTIRVSGSPSTFVTFLGNIQLTSKPGYVKSNEVIASNFLQNCEAYQSKRYGTGTVQMGNQTYANALCFDSYNNVKAEASFNLKGGYQSLSFMAGSAAGNNKNVQARTVTIEADGVQIYEQTILNDEVPKAANLNVSGVYQLTIYVSGSSSTFNTVLGKVNLVSNGKVSGISLDKTELVLSESNPAAYLKATITPPDTPNPSVVWSSSDPSVASVTSDGLVTGLKTGNATITAKTAEGGYEAACQVTVNLPVQTSAFKVSLSQTQYTYSGAENKPDVTVTYNGQTLQNGIDYTVTYTSNVNAGTGYVEVIGKGKYSGTTRAAFTIAKAKQSISVSGTTLTAGGTVAVKVTRLAGDGALSFQSDKTNVAVVSASTGKVTAKSAGLAVITVTAAETANYEAAVAKANIIVRPKNVTLKALKNTAMRKLVVSWKKSTDVTGYQIQYGTKSNFSGAKTKTITNCKTTSLKLSKVAKNKTYYVRIRTYKTVGGKKYYSTWSAKKSVKIRK